MDKQQERYELARQHLQHVWHRLDKMLDFLPVDDVIDDHDITDDQWDIIANVKAIEEEWLIDPELREQLSMVAFIDGED